MTTPTTPRRLRRTAGALLAGSALVLAGCTAGATDADGTTPNDPIQLAVVPGWAEGEAVTELWRQVLEEQGYQVEISSADIAAVYTGVARGDYDLFLDTWLPVTHAQYVDRFGDDVVDLGAWNDEGRNVIAVNEDAPIDSLAELAENADLFGNRIVGTEPGSGLMTMTQEEVIPGYGLDDMELTASSAPAMLAALESATAAGENIAVTLWSPHWAYDAFPVKNLEDPEGLFGGDESMHAMGSAGFEDEYPEVAEWIRDFEMDNAILAPLQKAMFYDRPDEDPATVVADWIADNRDWVDALTD